ncbi:MAG: hypothetical protein ABR577_11365 [Pyrinomonadaceae bacterium]
MKASPGGAPAGRLFLSPRDEAYAFSLDRRARLRIEIKRNGGINRSSAAIRQRFPTRCIHAHFK